ncbi:MAG: hypothetical protein RDU89_06800 [bacterium]|nr:hypothetical protein [bacterium]
MRSAKLLAPLMLALFLLAVSCSTAALETEFVIRLSGTPGLEWHGGYMVVNAQGQSVSTSVQGRLPAEYRARGVIVSVSFQKQVENGLLRVEVLSGGKVVVSGETTAAYGVVAVATPR